MNRNNGHLVLCSSLLRKVDEMTVPKFNFIWFFFQELNTALHWAAYAGSVDIATMFLAAGCDIDCPNDHGDRPL